MKKLDARITPLMEPYLKDTDTPEIINRAFQIAEEHAYVQCEPMGTPARFSTFLKDTEINPKTGAYLVPKGSVYEIHRFDQSLKVARKATS